MTQNVIDDLKYAKSVAEQGVESPLVGGRFGLMWGGLLCLVFFLQWAVLTQVLAVPSSWIGYFWLGFAIIGGVMSFVLDRSIRNKPGLSSTGNRADSAIWIFFSVMMLSCFIGVTISMKLGRADVSMFDTMVAVGFAGQGMAYGALSRVSGQNWLILPAAAAFVMAVVSFAFYGTAAMYLVASIGVLVTVVVPSAIQFSREPADAG